MHLLTILLLFPWSLVVGLILSCPMHGRAQWGARQCGPVGLPDAAAVQGGYQWVRPAQWPDQWDLMHNGRHVGSWRIGNGDFLYWDGPGRWREGVCPVDPPPGVETAPSIGQNFGVDLPRLDRSAAPTFRGKPISQARALELIGGVELPDYSGKRRLTVIGSDADRRPVMDALRGPLAPLVAEYVVADYPPEHWAVAKAGFVTTGKPTIYLQEPNGSVVFRRDDATGIKAALEAVRKPGPYDPNKDPDPLKPSPLLAADNLPLTAAVGVLGLLVLAAVVGSLFAAAHSAESEDHP